MEYIIVACAILSALSGVRILYKMEYRETLRRIRRRIRRRTDSIKWLPCSVGGHVEPSVVDYEMGERCICERCGKVLLD